MIKSKAIIIILYALGLSLLFGLSLWQYQRGQNKQVIVDKRASENLGILMSAPNNWADYYFRDVQIKGQWQFEQSFLLQNRIYKGQVGYEVLMPFKLEQDNSLLMVNRGWVFEAPEDLVLPELAKASVLSGVVYQPEKGLVLGDAVLPNVMQNDDWPKKSLYMDLPVFSQLIESPLEPVVLVLAPNDPASFQRIWKAVVMTPAKHYGYAVQWLGLALTFVVYGVIWFRRKNPNDSSESLN